MKLDSCVQDLVKSIEWRNELPLHPEESDIEDTDDLKIDWLIDVKSLEIKGKDDRSVMMDNASIASFGNNSFFKKKDMLQQEDDMSQGETH